MRTLRKRLLSGFLSLVMALTLFPAAALAANGSEEQPAAPPANPFTDVKKGDWFYDAVQYVFANGFFSGTTATTYDPQGTLTRAMFVTVLGRMAGIDPADYAGDTGFADVPENAWYAPYVKWAAQFGIALGTGDGRFSPDGEIDRAQMAVFFVRYFELFGVSYETGANVTTPPADLDSVPDYARDAVLKLWRQGLLNGDGTNFAPNDTASRAQAAALCMRADRAVETWYSEPGVPSGRESVDPAAQEESGNSQASGGSGGTSAEGRYTITLNMPDGNADTVTQTSAVLNISGLSTPKQDGYYFLGWYYDQDFTRQALDGDTLTSASTALYAKMLQSGAVETSDTPYYTVATDVETTFTITVNSTSDANLTDQITFTGPEQFVDNSSEDTAILTVTKNGNTYTISGPGGKLAAGGSYQVVLENDALTFAGQDASIREYHFTVAAGDPVMNLHLKDSVKEIPLGSISNIQQNGTQVASMSLSPVALQAGETAGTNVNTGLGDDTGTFDSTDGSIRIGDTLAIYAGNTRPDERDETSSELDEVSYVTITNKADNKDGTYTYAYTAATTEEVVFTPDVLPIQSGWDIDTTDEYVLTISEANLTKAMSDVEADSLDAGDFLAFYTGDALDGESTTESDGRTITGYGCITSWSEHYADGAYSYVIAYSDATADEVLASMDVTTTNDVSGDDLMGGLSEDELKDLEDDIAQQAMDSGFAQAVGQNIAMAVSTMDLSELEDGELDLSALNLNTLAAQDLSFGTLQTASVTIFADTGTGGGSSGPEVEVKVKAVDISKKLNHFEGKSGVRIALSLEVTITFDGVGEEGEALEITVTPTFVQELRLSISTKGGAEWRWKWKFIPYIYDFYAKVSVDMYTYTSINLDATVSTTSEGDTVSDVKDLVSDIQDLVGKLKTKLEGGNIEVAEGISELQDLYREMLENDSEWVTLYRKSIQQNEWVVAKIIKINLDIDFVVQANVNISLGLKFDYENAKRYTYNIYIFHGKATSNHSELVPESYNLQLYAMGTLGIRAGVETCLSVSLISKKVASVGVVGNVGAYLKVYGYVVYELHHTANQPDTSSGSGALYIEVGCYLDIGMDLSAFNGKLSWKPTLYSKEWPLWSAGSAMAVTGFAAAPDEDTEDAETPTLYMKKGTFEAIPSDLLTMKGFDLRTGAETTKVCTLDQFDISFSDERFKLDETSGQITVDFGEGVSWETCDEPVIECDMAITWKGAPLSFNTETIQLQAKLHWDRLEDAYYINYNTGIGKALPAETRKYQAAINPTTPECPGYTFLGWYTDAGCTEALAETNMPERNLTLYARWEVRTDIEYTIVPMFQQPDGTYTAGQKYTQSNGRVDITFAPTLNDYDGYVTPDIGDYWRIKADGTSEITANYPRQRYALVLDNAGALWTTSILYGDPIDVPTPTRDGYTFNGWKVEKDNGDGSFTELDIFPGAMPKYALKLTAKWTPNTNTAYTVNIFKEKAGGGYELAETKSFAATTDTVVKADAADEGTAAGSTFTLPTYDGYTLRENCRNITFTVKGNGTASENYYYNLNRRTLTIHHNSDNGKIHETQEAMQVGTTLAAAKTFTGYTLEGYYTDAACTAESKVNYPTALSSDMTLYAKWTANSVSYTVEHYQQALDGTYPDTPTDAETLSGKVDEAVTPTRKSYEGFTAPDGTQFTLKAAEEDNVIRYQYPRSSHQLKLELNGGTVSGTSEASVQYGAAVTVPEADPSRAGYTFGGWFTDSACITEFTENTTMPAGDLTLYAKWTAQDNIAYTVEHYQQNAGDDGYTIADTESKTGTAGEQTAAQAKNYEGFTLKGSVTQNAIAGDGSTVVKLYYDRATYTLTYDLNAERASFNDGTASSAAYRHGASVSLLTAQSLTYAGYSFGGWFTDKDCTQPFTDTTMPMSDTTLYAKWTAGNTSYTVNVYLQNIDDDDYTKSAEKSYASTGTVDTTAPAPASLEGFDTPEASSLKLSADGSENVIDYYYTRKSFTVTWNARNDTTAGTDTVKYGAAVTAPETDPTRTGYTFGGWFTDESCGTALAETAAMPAGDQTLYAKWTPISYTLRFNADGNVPLKTWLLAQAGAQETPPEADGNGGYGSHNNWGIPYIDFTMTYGEAFSLPSADTTVTIGGKTYNLKDCGVTGFTYGEFKFDSASGSYISPTEVDLGGSIQNAADTDDEIVPVNIVWPSISLVTGESSTEDNPAKIYSVSQLWEALAGSSNTYYPYSQLMVDLEVHNQTAASSHGNGGSSGWFDGNGHTIKALKSINTMSGWMGVLDTKRATNFTVKNVTLEGFTVTYAHSTGEGAANDHGYYGGLFGEVGDNFTLESVTVKDLTMNLTLNGAIREYPTLTQDCVGGLIGYADGAVTLRNCTVTGTTMNVTLPENSTAAVGSLIGYVAGGTASVTIENCSFDSVGTLNQFGYVATPATEENAA